ncbi:MAG: ABC transporter [Spirochaetes bacterium GWF1_31_7]|nr:MAG: ABC transporter [Spirochaetes bacterium GWE1_32_154]OHD46904.1 MAG: ABC transporter [Spirochaetes bacterium GWF1_31_7]OHD48682.1 MAG: ABC transporter [Spirochaetes bacterium GWE2_31_10]OHD74553.1 MAG: ABC transporter [Spirochaetes bacterium RIFOXYB1_FULL_32_8]HBD94908.1 lipoprotein-releasing system ATP-binding protein LolD [Spirochaetia bacterium]
MNVVETKNLVKDYVTNSIVVNALRGVNVEIKKGEFTAIVGPSGSGKSTLLHLIGCLDTPTDGDILINNKQVKGLKKNDLAFLRRDKIGFIFQAYNLIPVLTAYENVSFPLTLLGYKTKDIRDISMNALKEVGLEGMENRRPKELSGGQQQRIAIARALAKKPELILADEPTANLDSTTGTEILELMLKLNKTENTTFIFSTHDKMVMDYARRLIFIRDGLIQKEERK